MSAFTNTAIEAMQPGTELKDDRVPGLSVRARRGGRSFLLYYRFHGRPRRPKIGDYGVLGIKDARDIARAMLARVAAGEDPSAQRALHRSEPTLNELWNRCEVEHYNRGKTWDAEAKRVYEKNIKPKIGKTFVSAIGYDEAKAVHKALAAHPSQGNRALAVLSKMLDLAERFKMRPLGSNPCRLVSRFPEQSRRRYATPDEVKRIAAVMEKKAADEGNLSGLAFLYLLMFSGARPSEIGRAPPSILERVERDGKTFGVLRIAEGKTGRRDVFLPPQAMAVIDRLPAKRTWLAGRRTVPKELWHEIRDEAGCPDLWARDWRRTFGVVGLSNGVTLDKLGELFGHKDPRTTKVYATLLEDKAHESAAAVADKLSEMMGGS